MTSTRSVNCGLIVRPFRLRCIGPNSFFTSLQYLRIGATISVAAFGTRLKKSMSSLHNSKIRKLIRTSLIALDQLICPFLCRVSKLANSTSKAKQPGTAMKTFFILLRNLVVFQLQLWASPYSSYAAPTAIPRRMPWLISFTARTTIVTYVSKRKTTLRTRRKSPKSYSRNVWRAAANWAAITAFAFS